MVKQHSNNAAECHVLSAVGLDVDSTSDIGAEISARRLPERHSAVIRNLHNLIVVNVRSQIYILTCCKVRVKNQHLLISGGKALFLSDIEESGNALNLISVRLNHKCGISQEIGIKTACGGGESLTKSSIVALKEVDRLYAVRR